MPAQPAGQFQSGAIGQAFNRIPSFGYYFRLGNLFSSGKSCQAEMKVSNFHQASIISITYACPNDPTRRARMGPRSGSVAAKSNAPSFEFGNLAVLWPELQCEFAGILLTY